MLVLALKPGEAVSLQNVFIEQDGKFIPVSVCRIIGINGTKDNIRLGFVMPAEIVIRRHLRNGEMLPARSNKIGAEGAGAGAGGGA